MSTPTITGVPEVDAKLRNIDTKVAKRVGRKAVNAGLRVLAKRIKAAVPEAETTGHGRRKLQTSVGTRNKKNRRANVQEAKAGIGVGNAAKKAVPHAHLIAAGTGERYTGSSTRRGRTKSTGNQRAYRGRVTPRPFVRTGGTVSQSEVLQVMIDKLKEITHG